MSPFHRTKDLPNLDTGGFAGNKTDAFIALVFENTCECGFLCVRVWFEN